MSIFKRLFGKAAPDPKYALEPLYARVIAKGREVHWYEQGQVPDTLDGRFDMIATILAILLLRMEQIEGAGPDSAYLTELFVDDMDAQMREAGIGDVVVAKDMGKIMSILGGRLGAFKGAFDDPAKLDAAIARNIHGVDAAEDAARAHLAASLTAYWQQLQSLDHPQLIAGQIA
jgi:cytochrome b pre-mRNA-processing protein 3